MQRREMINLYRILEGKPKGKKPFAASRLS
jgi:hypothetical protein